MVATSDAIDGRLLVEERDSPSGVSTVTGSPYFYAPLLEGVGVLAPPILITILVLLLYPDNPYGSSTSNELPVWMWGIAIVCIDVAHVWSTLFRTYLDPIARRAFMLPLAVTPLFCWVLGVLLYYLGAGVFWTVFAYLAVFHFVRQQYGVYALYARTLTYRSNWSRRVDVAAVYLSALYPLLYWHAHLPRSFHWFVEGDFAFYIPEFIAQIAGGVLAAVLLAQIVEEILHGFSGFESRLPKNLVIWGTAAAWYIGIVHYNSDIPFTLTNVVAHGVPYLTLVWIFARKRFASTEVRSVSSHKTEGMASILFGSSTRPRIFLCVGVFLLSVVTLAYLEEAIWDALVWRDHADLFAWSWMLPAIEADEVLMIVVPLLAVPQATHYVLDGFIWRIRGSGNRKSESHSIGS